MTDLATGRERGKPSRAGGTGKDKRQPRSLGLTYAAVRHDLRLSQSAMHEHLEKIASEYVFPAPAPKRAAGARLRQSERRKQDTQRRRSAISRWERSLGNPPFSVSHRYGVASGTFSGVLDLTSLIYAELREAGSASNPTQHLQRIDELCSRIGRFSATARRLSRRFHEIKEKYNLDKAPDDPTARHKHLDLINAILDGFRGARDRLSTE
jgi:hypothetical protein